MTHPLNPLTRTFGDNTREYPIRAHDVYRAMGFNHCPPADHSDTIGWQYDGGRSTHTISFVSRAEARALGFKQRALTGCPICGKLLTVGCLDQHMTTVHPV